jgi:alginate O-acetyltransferase complex protein AlgI
MLFNSPEFIVFCLLVYAVYLVLPFRLQNFMLLIASYIFYGWWDPRFLFLVALSTTVDFWVGLMIENGRLQLRQWTIAASFLTLSALAFLGVNAAAIHPVAERTNNLGSLIKLEQMPWILIAATSFIAFLTFVFWISTKLTDTNRRLSCLMVSLVTQLGLLGVFKYFNFFASSLTSALTEIGLPTHNLHLNIVLPVGVSFYTFQSLSYTIDIYRGQFKPTARFFDFALFVAYFPQLQAGPIERARHLIPQLSQPRELNLDQTARGLYLIVLGFFKKVAIADGVAPIADQIFSSTGHVTWIDVVAGTVFFAVQIYCDFSGYTDIARGVSKLFGIDLMVNFNQPYFATNPQEFWRRWHISLSTWLRDYLYVPLGGNRGNLLFVCRNLMITMLLGGLWHGAAWNYVLWGFYQGGSLCIYRIWHRLSDRIPARTSGGSQHLVSKMLRRLAASAAFLLVICYGWLLFRAHSLAQITHFSWLLIRDFGDLNYGGGAPRFSSMFGIVLLVAMEITEYWSQDRHYYRRLAIPVRGFLIASMLAITLMGMSNEPAQFIYFQF